MSHQISSLSSSGPDIARCLKGDPPLTVEAPPSETPPEEVLALRACVRDLVALTTLPAVWTGRPMVAIAGDLADALLGILRADLVALRLEPTPEDPPIELLRTDPSPDAVPLCAIAPETVWAHAIMEGSPITTIPNPTGKATLRVLTAPIGHGGALGRVAVGSRRPDFPSATERLLLNTGVNQAAIALAGARAAAALARQERELSDFVENANVAMHWVGPDGTILWANHAEMQFLGYRPNEYLGRHIAEFHVDQPAIADILARLSRGETLRDYPARLRCRDGSIKDVLIHSSVLWEDGRFVHTRCFTRDITDQKRAERRLALQYAVAQALAESETLDAAGAPILRTICETLGWAAGLLWTVDRQTATLHCVDVWHLPTGTGAEFTAVSRARTFPSGVGLPGRVWASGDGVWIPDLSADAGFSRTADAARAGLRSAFGFPVREGDDILGVLEFFSREISTPDDELLALMIATGSQIGQFIQRRRAEAGRARALEAAREALRARDEFLSAAAHDLKTPLAVIKGGAQMLQRQAARHAVAFPDRMRAQLASLDTAATRLSRLVDQLLDMTRLEAGHRLDLDRRPTDLVALAQRAVAGHQQTTERHQLRVAATVPDLVGWWDAARLERVLDNLLSNAIKYSPAGGDILVRVAPADDAAATWAMLAVEDPGVGIPAEELPQVFARFHRAANVLGRIPGTRIGLANARQLVELHGGTIAVASQEGRGSTFTVRLPIRAPEHASPGGETG